MSKEESKSIIKDYSPTGVLSFTTPRAVSKAKVTKDDRERLKWYFSKQSSNSVPFNSCQVVLISIY